MKKNKIKLLPSIICLIPLIMGIILYPKLPDVVATHWNGKGEIDDYSSKLIGVIVFPLALALVSVFTPKLIELDPKNKDIDNKVKNVITWIIPVICFVASSVTLLEALGKQVKVEIIIPMAVGVVLVIIGNYLPKTKQNYTVGIKIPWTIDNEENWNKTHRIGGFMFVLGGITIAVSSLFKCRVIVMLIAMFMMILVPTIYSYMLYRKQK